MYAEQSIGDHKLKVCMCVYMHVLTSRFLLSPSVLLTPKQRLVVIIIIDVTPFISQKTRQFLMCDVIFVKKATIFSQLGQNSLGMSRRCLVNLAVQTTKEGS